ncbi:MAG TPA: hypothetical protein VFV91_04115 [Gaiellaceae bacterium]|jgi:hypothetical protein|nr:hypothetical protein [Gaiellaceae bacterium]
MKISTLALALAAIMLAGAFGASRASATTSHQTATKTLRIVMRDPGCHWFKIGGKFTTKASVKGRVRLVDLDEATLKVVSRHGMRHIAVGKSIVVGRGSYVIMMVGQASDDNYLKLSVR